MRNGAYSDLPNSQVRDSCGINNRNDTGLPRCNDAVFDNTRGLDKDALGKFGENLVAGMQLVDPDIQVYLQHPLSCLETARIDVWIHIPGQYERADEQRMFQGWQIRLRQSGLAPRRAPERASPRQPLQPSPGPGAASAAPGRR